MNARLVLGKISLVTTGQLLLDWLPVIVIVEKGETLYRLIHQSAFGVSLGVKNNTVMMIQKDILLFQMKVSRAPKEIGIEGEKNRKKERRRAEVKIPGLVSYTVCTLYQLVSMILQVF